MIAEISAIIATMNDYQMAMSSEVEEQTATTEEVSRGVAEAAAGSSEIVVDVAGVVQSSSEAMNHPQASTGELTRLAVDLRIRVGAFIC